MCDFDCKSSYFPTVNYNICHNIMQVIPVNHLHLT